MQTNKQEKSLIKQNILKYLKSIDVTPYECYKKTGITRSILTQNNGITEENILKFLAYYKEVDIAWLITGRDISTNQESSKYEKKEESKLINDFKISSYSCPDCIEWEKKLEVKSNEVLELKEKCELQKKLIKEYEVQLGKNGQAQCV